MLLLGSAVLNEVARLTRRRKPDVQLRTAGRACLLNG